MPGHGLRIQGLPWPDSRPYVFVSGAYSGDSEEVVRENVKRAVETADRISKYCWPILPHLCHLWESICPHEYGFWILYSRAMMVLCDGMLRMDGPSPGADDEEIVWLVADGPLFYTEPELEAWCREFTRTRLGRLRKIRNGDG